MQIFFLGTLAERYLYLKTDKTYLNETMHEIMYFCKSF